MATCKKIVRLSVSGDNEDLINQEQVIDPYIKTKGYTAKEPILLNGVKRWDMRTEKEAIINEIKKEPTDFLIYRDHTRIGFKGTEELFKFIVELDYYGTKIINADKDLIYDLSNSEKITSIAKSQEASDAEIRDKSDRTQWARRKTVQRKSKPGSTPPFGYDYIVYKRTGEVRFKVVYEGWKRCEGEHKANKSTHPNYALMRIKVYSDGSRERYDDEWIWDEDKKKWFLRRCKPSMEKGDTKREVINKEREPIVRLIFSLADRPLWMTPYQIALELTKRGIESFSGRWGGNPIRFILQNPIYKGYPCDNRTTQAKTTRKYTDVIEYPLTDEDRKAIRIIDVEQWERVNNKLKDRPEKYKRSRRPNHDDFWAKTFLTCACGEHVYIQSRQLRDRADRYRCADCGSVKVSVIHAIIHDWLKDITSEYENCHKIICGDYIDSELTGNGLLDQYKSVYHKICEYNKDFMERNKISLNKKVQKDKLLEIATSVAKDNGKEIGKNDALKSLMSRLFDCVNDEEMKALYKIRPVSDKKVDINAQLYYIFFEYDNQHIREQINKISQEIRTLTSTSFVSATMMKECDKRIKELEDRQTKLEASMVSLLPEFDRIEKSLRRAAIAADQLRQDVMNATGENKKVLLEPYLKQIVITFNNTTQERRKTLDKVVIIPQDETLGEKVYDRAACYEMNKRFDMTGKHERTPEMSACYEMNKRFDMTGKHERTPEMRARFSESRRKKSLTC